MSPEGSEVAYPHGRDGTKRIGANFSDGWSALKGYLAAGTQHTWKDAKRSDEENCFTMDGRSRPARRPARRTGGLGP